jgi:hypothetical protein
VVAAEADRLGGFEVVSGRDVQAMLGFERARELAGCDDLACFAEIGGALGAQRILVSSVGAGRRSGVAPSSPYRQIRLRCRELRAQPSLRPGNPRLGPGV